MIETERLVLRGWQPSDLAPLGEMVDDPETMRFLLPVPDAEALKTAIATRKAWQDAHGFTFWSVERRSDGAFLGLCGLKPGAPGTPIEDEVEIGWQFARAHWRQGHAREAAQAVLDWAWTNLAVSELFAITVPDNRASWQLMARLGMEPMTGQDFDHPLVPDGSPLKRHILYRIARP